MTSRLVKDIGEFELVKLVTEGLAYSQQTILGVGDDCAVYEISKGRYILATCDMLVEDVHFSTKTASAFLIGCKAIACSLSDIAAMGGNPLFTLISLGLPETTGEEFIHDLYVGIRSICREYGVVLLGGDTVRSPENIVIDVSMVGDCPRGKFVTRSGAKAGDLVVVTGYLGDSAAGLDLLNGKFEEPDTERRSRIVERHLAPEPRCEQGRFLAENFDINAMIDISDGLAGDLGHICEASKLGARLRSDWIPVSNPLREFSESAGIDPLTYALAGGEDYELLFTLAPKEFERLEELWPEEFELPLFQIGEMDKSLGGIYLVYPDGSERLVDSKSFEHFRKG